MWDVILILILLWCFNRGDNFNSKYLSRKIQKLRKCQSLQTKTGHPQCNSLHDSCVKLTSCVNGLVIRFRVKGSHVGHVGKHWLNRGPWCERGLRCRVITWVMFISDKHTVFLWLSVSSQMFCYFSFDFHRLQILFVHIQNGGGQNGIFWQMAVVFLIHIIHVRPVIHSEELQKCQHLVRRIAQCSTFS